MLILYSNALFLSLIKYKGLFVGDMPLSVSVGLADKHLINSTKCIKIHHHGSKNGLTQNLLEKISPQMAIISVVKDNQ